MEAAEQFIGNSFSGANQMSAWIAVFVIVAICICTIHLVLGIWLGQNLVEKGQVALPQMEQITDQLRERLADIVCLTSQARALSEECSNANPKLPANIVLQAGSVARDSSLLQKNMEKMTRALPQRNETTAALESAQAVDATGPREPVRFDTTRVTRFRYEVWQHVAPIMDGQLPAPSEFESVECRDLSREGFSFSAEELPATELLVVAMGSPPDLRFFTARVIASPPASRHGEVGYQIECEFVNKLTQVYQWDQSQGRIIAGSAADCEAERRPITSMAVSGVGQ